MDALLDSCAYGAVRIIGIKQAGSCFIVRLCGARGSGRRFEPRAGKAFQVGKRLAPFLRGGRKSACAGWCSNWGIS